VDLRPAGVGLWGFAARSGHARGGGLEAEDLGVGLWGSAAVKGAPYEAPRSPAGSALVEHYEQGYHKDDHCEGLP
jgi:hypothetical protein